MCVRLLNKAFLTTLLCGLWILYSGFIKTPAGLTKHGNEDFNEKRYESALKKYREAHLKRHNPFQAADITVRIPILIHALYGHVELIGLYGCCFTRF